jgi:GT2 family glycosyltransferase
MNRAIVFDKSLAALYDATSTINAEIIIVNDSKTSTPIIPKLFTDRVKLINNPKSGVASARNFGVANATHINLLFMDDDMLVSTQNIHELVKNITENNAIAYNFNWIYPPQLTELIAYTQFGRYLINYGFTSLKGWAEGLTWEDKPLFEVDLVASYFLSITKQNFNIIGGYNESFPHAGAEDFEFAKRLKQSSVKGMLNTTTMVLHNEEDRVALLPWLNRRERGAQTRKVAVNLGHAEVGIKASIIKQYVYSIIYAFKPVFFLILKGIPNTKKLDIVYFKIINILLGAYLSKGYNAIK